MLNWVPTVILLLLQGHLGYEALTASAKHGPIPATSTCQGSVEDASLGIEAQAVLAHVTDSRRLSPAEWVLLTAWWLAMHPACESQTHDLHLYPPPTVAPPDQADSPLPECLLLTQARFRDGPAR